MLRLWTFCALTLFGLGACKNLAKDEASSRLSEGSVGGGSTIDPNGQKIVKIIAAGSGAAGEVQPQILDINAELGLRAALFDLASGEYIQDVQVVWTASGGGFNSKDFIGETDSTTSVVFDPTRTGNTVIQATYVGTDETVIGTVDSTGTISVQTSLVPGNIQRVSGNSQSDLVNTILANALRVRVTTDEGDAVPGAAVNFTALTGSGTVVTGQPVRTGPDGYAEATVQLSTTPIAHVFRATVAQDSSLFVDFSATASVGTANVLIFSSQPGGATVDETFT